jgi:hypothetical protein
MMKVLNSRLWTISGHFGGRCNLLFALALQFRQIRTRGGERFV